MKVVYRMWWSVWIPLMLSGVVGGLFASALYGIHSRAPSWLSALYSAALAWTAVGGIIAAIQLLRAIWSGRDILDSFD